ncbi:hypothetical protein MATL_G00032580 [Megalops atlanticus]|uniref:Uncharacterized protein n=1 Tax=Megalops atlanticus TaxID=7932 RepID=A0A9D3QGT6_MEGAT|nr:hypothetical protein MATL_G00032580 [Megalops atlanticus]
MTARILLLLVSLCLWEELGGGASVTKVLRRRGLGAHVQVRTDRKVANQRDPHFEKYKVPSAKLKSFENRANAGDVNLSIQSKMVLNSAAVPVFRGKGVKTRSSEFALKLRERSMYSLDLAVHSTLEKGGVALDSAESWNGERSQQSPEERREPRRGQ